ncbi:MAG: carboxymuconolactone decarboxylase family protein [Bacteriovoracaceae bacterium]|nr:carboxymuconolactone decarboxylase family protein [Bacteriovoracaceae bacterium]
MSLDFFKDSLKDYAKDIKLNLSSILTPEGAPGLNESQIWSTALACVYATNNQPLKEVFESEAVTHLAPEYIEPAKGAATLMAMNNVYYRFLHLSENKEFSKMPARLRMNFIGKPGIAKVDFELMCLAVSAIAGCGLCINSHIHEVTKAGLSLEGAQSSIRIAAVVNASAQAQWLN